MQQNIPKFILAALVILLGNSFQASAQSDEKDPKSCESELGSPATAAPVPAFELAAEVTTSATDMAWMAAENRLWLVTIDDRAWSVELYEPLHQSTAVYAWNNIPMLAEQPAGWGKTEDNLYALIMGEQAMLMDFLQPSRVRIMPVGGVVNQSASIEDHNVRRNFSVWSETNPDNQTYLKLAQLNSMESLLLKFPIDAKELVIRYQFLNVESQPFLAVLTGQRILLFKVPSH